MKLEKHFERLCKKVTFADDILLKFIDYIMINENNHSIRSYNLLEEILKQYHKNDKGFKKTRYMFLDDNKELFRDLRAKCAFYGGIDFVDVKNYPYMFDEYLKCDAGMISENGRIVYHKLGAERTFFVGLPIYDLENNKLGVLSYICDDEGWYWWEILGYKGKRQEIKTYWQVLKSQSGQ